MQRHFVRQLAITFILAVAIDVVGGLHIRSLVHDALGMAIGTVVITHYLAFLGWVWFIDEKSNWRRLALTTATALGAAGTVIVLGLS